MSSESIFGHNLLAQEYDPPISQSSVMQLEADLSMRPTVDDTNPSTTTVFSSDRTTALLTTKLSSADVKDYAISTVETADQTVKSHVLSEQTTFDADQQLVSKKYVDDNSGSITSNETDVATINNNVLSFPHIDMASVNTIIGNGAAYQGSVGRTTLYGRDAARSAGNLSDIVCVGWQSHYGAQSGRYSVVVGAQANKYRRQEDTIAIGRQAGHLLQTDTGGSMGYSANIYIGSQAGANHRTGSNCVMIGKGVTDQNADSRLLIGSGGNHLIKGTFGTTTNAVIELNANKIKLPTTLPTQADYANLDAGDVYVDTSDANVLKMK